jgi:hypothetical protein
MQKRVVGGYFSLQKGWSSLHAHSKGIIAFWNLIKTDESLKRSFLLVFMCM